MRVRKAKEVLDNHRQLIVTTATISRYRTGQCINTTPSRRKSIYLPPRARNFPLPPTLRIISTAPLKAPLKAATISQASSVGLFLSIFVFTRKMSSFLIFLFQTCSAFFSVFVAAKGTKYVNRNSGTKTSSGNGSTPHYTIN